MKKFFTVIAVVTALLGINAGLHAQNDGSMKTKEIPQNISAFPIGNENVAYQQYFTGKSWLARLATDKDLNVPISNVTFEPGCRNNWHSHTGGQILIAVGGRGYYQEKGKPAQLLLPGNVVEIAPNVIHWHGAAPDSWFSHLAIECNPSSNKNTWFDPVDDRQYAEATSTGVRLSENATKNIRAWFPASSSTLDTTDPELAEIFGNFAFGETQQYGDLDVRTRILVTMASTIAQNTEEIYRQMLAAAYANGISPMEVKEVLYHAAPYVGMARVASLLGVANEFLAERGVKLPLEPQSVTTPDTRMEKGLALQKSIFGEHIDKMRQTAPANQLHIQQYLSANCFGDYQTRRVFDTPMRELLTYAMLISLGGCEPQVKSHIQGNVNVGNDKSVLLAVTTQLLPYIGYPRTLNAIACLNEVIPEKR